jgi:creatinine amidohydrolase
MRDVRLEHLRPAEILAERKRLPLVYLPTGSIEWHGPHLPLGVDMLLAYEVAQRLARKLGGVVHPPIYCGTERERSPQMLRNIGFPADAWVVGMDFPKNSMRSLYYPEEVFALMLRQALERLVEAGYKLIVIVNGHGAENQLNTLQRQAAAITAQGRARVLVGFPNLNADEEAEQAIAGHADIIETAMMLALMPESVDLSALPPLDTPLHNLDFAVVDSPTFSGQPTADFTVRPQFDPRRATAEMGQRYLQNMVASLAAQVREALAGLKG